VFVDCKTDSNFDLSVSSLWNGGGLAWPSSFPFGNYVPNRFSQFGESLDEHSLISPLGISEKQSVIVRSGGATAALKVEPWSDTVGVPHILSSVSFGHPMFENVITFMDTSIQMDDTPYTCVQMYVNPGTGWSTLPDPSGLSANLWFEFTWIDDSGDLQTAYSYDDNTSIMVANNWTVVRIDNADSGITATNGTLARIRGFLATYEAGNSIYVDPEPIFVEA